MDKIKSGQIIELKVPFEVPQGFVMVKEEDLEKLLEEDQESATGNRAWLFRRLGVSNHKLNQLLLDPFRDELDMKNGGMIHYSEGKGDELIVYISEFNKWFDDNFRRVLGAS